MSALAKIASAALLLTPLETESPLSPHSFIALAYTCLPDGRIESAWGRDAARVSPGTILDRGEGFHVDASTLPSHGEALSAPRRKLLTEERDDEEDIPELMLYPSARIPSNDGTSSLSVRLLEFEDEARVGVALLNEDENELPSLSARKTLSWSEIHHRADVRLDALLALHGQMRMVDAVRGTAPPPTDIDATVAAVVRAFELHLKHTPAVDRWAAKDFDPTATDILSSTGATRFGATARRFIERGAPIPCVLPAFPCKSPNKNKSSGILPDKGEDLAAQTLTHFAHAVEAIYPPGAVIHIVSDGHTFSDLLRVPDDEVDVYSAHVKGVFRRYDADLSLFRFHGLDDLLHTRPLGLERRGVRSTLGDLMRQTLTALWGPRDIASFATADAFKLSLLRGLSRFMLDDLDQLPEFKAMSKSKRKRQAMEVALMMISRNESYSQLVDLSFPGAVRLSIHPHNNSGPKYAIALLHPRFRRPDAGELLSDQTAGHTPTPWHNVTLLVIGDDGERRFELMHREKLDEHRPSPAHELEWVPIAATSAEYGGYYRFLSA